MASHSWRTPPNMAFGADFDSDIGNSGQSAFPWFSRIWDLQLEQAEFEAGLPDPTFGWRVIGLIKLLVGIGLGVLLLMGSKLERIKADKKMNRRISKSQN